jgi:hypothetical protein
MVLKRRLYVAFGRIGCKLSAASYRLWGEEAASYWLMVLKRRLYMAYCVKDDFFFEGVAW